VAPTSSAHRVALAAVVALSAGLTVVSLAAGFSESVPIRLIEGVAVFIAGAAALSGVTVLALVHLAGWRDPESEQEFEALVRRTERLAATGPGRAPEDLLDFAWEDRPVSARSWAADEQDEDERAFRALVRTAIDELPLEFHRALEHVAVVISNEGGRYGAYGLYQGDTIAQDHFHDRILIFRDTLTRDFGHDAGLLARQVRRTLRHELAHHLGWDERGVRGLGL
jgi:predicted Zn-dependent protease with MMP-like domain